MSKAVAVARATARRIADDLGLPAYLYGESSQRKLTLPEIRRGGLEGLIRRTEDGFLPDLGPTDIDPTRGAICIGAREVLIAFNVWLEIAASAAREIARSIREADGGLPGVRAIGLDMGGGLCQVSMNLTAPHITGIEAAFAAISSAANRLGGRITRTELVGLPPARYLPGPDAETARLMDPPGRSLESMLP
jgi:glutamate formiminotransferase